MNKIKHTTLYVVSDFLTAIASWTIFFLLRKQFIDISFGNFHKEVSLDINYFYGLCIIPFMWLLLYYLNGYYKNIYRKSRLNEFLQTFILTAFGSLIIFFVLLLDDNIYSYFSYYKSLVFLFSIHFILTYTPRAIITSITNSKIHNRKIGFNTLLVGSNAKAQALYEKLQSKTKSSGNKFIGFVNVIEQQNYVMEEYMPHLGNIEHIKSVFKKHEIDEIIIAIESKEHQYIEHILLYLEGTKACIKAIPDNCDILSGRVTINSIHDEPLILISHDLMPSWQENTKRVMDVTASIIFLLLCSPLYLFLTIGVKFSSKGPIFYKQKRIGRYGKPFYIFKFRSMFVGSEKHGPALASKNDKRITKFGQFMRKSRLDEIPQFFNVLIGDMSLVGPRPERQFFINQIMPIAPHYRHLQKVRPGITSWGQVKYGYAKNVEEMVERLNYDIIYIENMSLYIDIKILIYTIKTVILGKGI